MKQLYIVGLGRGDLPSLAILDNAKLRAVSTFICPAAPPHLKRFLQEKGCHLTNLAALQDKTEKLSPAGMNEIIMALLRNITEPEGAAALLLPGGPWPGDSMTNLLKRHFDPQHTALHYLPGEDLMPSLLQSLEDGVKQNGDCPGTDLAFSFNRGVTIFDAVCWDELKDPPRGELLISQVYSREILAKLAGQLRHIYPVEHPVALWQYDQYGKAFLCARWPLQELGMNSGVSLHTWSFLHLSPPPRCSLGEMTSIMARLRSPGGCPWDRRQDHRSLRPYLLEETYEVLEAIDNGKATHLCEELGDLLLQVIFHSELARERGDFSLWDVIDGITRKIYRRHPHVFDNESLDDAAAVARLWQEIKLQEKKGKSDRDIFALTAGLPALMQAQKVQKRAAAVGFDWPDIYGALEKVAEELRELEFARRSEGKVKVEEEYGDILFALVNVARFLGVDAEQALAAAVRKFTRRFKYIEKRVDASGRNITACSLEELDKYWEEAKKRE